jgi:nucleotide-binding universal stress UspA family protein
MTQFKDTLVALATYPDPTPEHVIDQAVAFSHLLGARLSALVSVIDRHKLAKYYAHGAWLMDVPSLIDEIVGKSRADSQRLVERFKRTAAAQGVLQDELRENSAAFSSSDHLVACARLRDLTFLPVPDFIGLDELQTEDVIFGTGHPVVLLPAYEGAVVRKPSLDQIVVAWDFSQAAARALADAIPLLHMAAQVRILTVRGEKDIDDRQTLEDVRRHLQLHDILPVLDNIDIGDRSIFEAIDEYLQEHKADMLVMGAFGHSRMREFVLGGATRSMVTKPPLPVFLSH